MFKYFLFAIASQGGLLLAGGQEYLGEPDHHFFGGGAGVTFLHPLVGIAIVLAIILILCLPREYVIVPLLLSLFFTPKGQALVLAGVHLNAYRIIILAALARRTLKRSPPLAGGFNPIDRTVRLWAFSLVVMFALDWMDTQALIKGMGDLLDKLGGYFALRYLINDREDVVRTIKVLALVSVVMGMFMIYEQNTGVNFFHVIGGVGGDEIRDGKIRSQGAFEHSITASIFGATLPPLLVFLWSAEVKSRLTAALGLVGATTMMLTAHSSTAVMAYVAGIIGFCLWPVRGWMRLVRCGIVVILVALQLVMNGPVWSILEHIDLTGSSSSYHRYMLVDNFIRHFFDWWLVGNRVYGTWGWEMWDLSNQYVAAGLTGGLSTFALFVGIIYLGFSRTGNARKLVEYDGKEAWLLWCLSTALFAHVVAFFGISYFDQLEFAWFSLLAIISAVTACAQSSVAAVHVAGSATPPEERWFGQTPSGITAGLTRQL